MANGDNIYLFKDVEFRTGSRSWCVSEIYFNLRETGLPQVILMVDPVHTPSDPMTPATITSLKSMSEWHTQAQQIALKKEKATLKFKIYKKEVVEQEIELTDWITADAGLRTSGMSFALEITIQHPASEISMSGANLGSFNEVPKLSLNLASASDPLDALKKAVEQYALLKITQKVDTSCTAARMPSVITMEQAFKKRLKDAAKIMSEQIMWEPNYYEGCPYTDWPMTSGPLAGKTKHVALAIGGLVHGLADNTLWEILARELCSSFYLAILPTYWEKLKLVPFTPWAKYKVLIEDTEISDIQLPGFEKTTVAGITIEVRTPAFSGDYTVLVDRIFAEQFQVNRIVYTPDPQMVGSYITYSPPEWLEELSNMTGAEEGKTTNYSTSQPKDNARTAANSGPGDKLKSVDGEVYQRWMKQYRCALYLCAKQMYLATFHKSLQVRLKTKLMFKKDGTYLLPGQVVRVQADGKTVFDFYVTEVVHSINVSSGFAHTDITGAYPRADGVNVPGEGSNTACNPVWS